MKSTPTRKALLIFWSVLYLHHFLQPSIPQNLGVESKVTTLAMDSMYIFSDSLLHLQAVFRVTKRKCLCGNRVSLQFFFIDRDDLHQWIYELHIKDHQWSDRDHKFSGLPTYGLWYLGCILYHLLFGSPICNVDSHQTNSLMYIFIYHCFHFFAMFILLFLSFLALMLLILSFLCIVKNCERIIN